MTLLVRTPKPQAKRAYSLSIVDRDGDVSYDCPDAQSLDWDNYNTNYYDLCNYDDYNNNQKLLSFSADLEHSEGDDLIPDYHGEDDMIPDYHGEDDMIADLHDEDTDDQEDEDEDEQGGIADHSRYSPTPSVGSRTNRSIHIVTKYYCVFRELPLMMCFYGFLWVLAMGKNAYSHLILSYSH